MSSCGSILYTTSSCYREFIEPKMPHECKQIPSRQETEIIYHRDVCQLPSVHRGWNGVRQLGKEVDWSDFCIIIAQRLSSS